jgi:hypothetical protein
MSEKAIDEMNELNNLRIENAVLRDCKEDLTKRITILVHMINGDDQALRQIVNNGKQGETKCLTEKDANAEQAAKANVLAKMWIGLHKKCMIFVQRMLSCVE